MQQNQNSLLSFDQVVKIDRESAVWLVVVLILATVAVSVTVRAIFRSAAK